MNILTDEEISEYIDKNNRYKQAKQEIADSIRSEFIKNNSSNFKIFYKNYKAAHLLKKSKKRIACYSCSKNIAENSINIKTIVKNGIQEVNFHESCLDSLVYPSKNALNNF